MFAVLVAGLFHFRSKGTNQTGQYMNCPVDGFSTDTAPVPIPLPVPSYAAVRSPPCLPPS